MKNKVMNWSLFVFNSLYIVVFAIYYLYLKNYEFMIYIGVLVLLFILVVSIQKRVKFSYTILWMLSIWGLLHMLGGGLHLASGEVLYKWVPLHLYDMPDSGGEFVLLKFDQILHFYIYFVMSFVLAHLLKGRLKMRPLYFFAFVTITSIGLSVINELIEFCAVIFLGQTGVGGYFNTMLDFVFNSLGAIAGAVVCSLRR